MMLPAFNLSILDVKEEEHHDEKNSEPTEEDRLAVKKGAAFLDMVNPGWVDKINLETFDISKSNRCVLGQIFGDYDQGCAYLENNYDSELPDLWSYEYGFNKKIEQVQETGMKCYCGCGMELELGSNVVWWDTLTAAWKDYISERS